MTLKSHTVIDAFVEHDWNSKTDVVEYLPRAWREYLGRPGTLPGGGGMMEITPASPYTNPLGGTLLDAVPGSGGPAGSCPSTMSEHLLDRHGISKVVLGYTLSARMLPGHLNHHFANEMIRACNEWTVDHWLSGPDERYHGLILTQNHLPEVGAAEIRRLAGNPRMVGVLLGGNGLAQPFGHPIYDPIHRAAAENDLPIVIPAGSDLPVDVISEHTAGGPASTYAEMHMMANHSLMTHVASFVAQGVFVKYPNLKVHVVGGGVSWAIWVLWRFNAEYRAFRREVPWLTRQPGDYMLDHVRVSTAQLDQYGSRDSWEKLFVALPGLERMVTYASGYPTQEFDAPADVAAALPSEHHSAVFESNALDLYRWPLAAAATTSLAAEARLAKEGQR